MPTPADGTSARDSRFEDRLTNRVDVLADRLNTIATTVSTTAAGLAGKDGEIAMLRRELERGQAAIQTLASQAGGSAGTAEFDDLRKTIASLAARHPEQASDKHVERLSGRVDYLAERVDTLASTVAATAAGLAGREGDISALRKRFDGDVAQLARAVGDIRQPGGRDELTAQVISLSDAVAATAHDLARRQQETVELRSLVEEGRARLDSVLSDLRQALGTAVARVDALEATSNDDALQSLEQEAVEAATKIGELSSQLDSLRKIVDTTVAANAEKELEIAALGRRFEHSTSSVDAVVRDLSEAIAAMPANNGESPAIKADLAEIEERVEDLTDRLASVTRDHGAAAAELARTTAFWSAELRSVEARFDEPGARAEVGHHGADSTGGNAASLGGAGRFRVELRALEQRMEHAEAAGRENREAILTQLERLASRFDWRLQLLESEFAASPDDLAPLEAEVVRLRGVEP